jgi:predicted DNA-binding transcriptional regulator AlpA
VLALAKGELKLGALLSGLDSSELDEWLEEHQEWSDSYES